MKIQRNIFLHMTLSGLGGGVLLGTLYGVGIGVFLWYEPDGMYFANLLGLALLGIIYGGFFGGAAGLSMGIADGVLMWLVCRRERVTPQTTHRQCYGIALLVTFVTALFIAIVVGFDLVFIGLPAIIAAGASLLAVERYFAHHPLDSRKRKRKEKPA